MPKCPVCNAPVNRYAINGYILDIYSKDLPGEAKTLVFESSFDVIAYLDANIPSPKDV